MKTQLIVSSLIAAGLVLPASFAHAGELTVTVSDVRADKGTLMVMVVNTEAGWNNQEAPVAADQVAVKDKHEAGKPFVYKFTLPAGSYADQVMHDENDNGQLDMNALGVPVEAYGFSNNPVVMRRARFSEAKFDITGAPASVGVQLR
jgi:uncharacterized protein (DUF2141 family)